MFKRKTGTAAYLTHSKLNIFHVNADAQQLFIAHKRIQHTHGPFISFLDTSEKKVLLLHMLFSIDLSPVVSGGDSNHSPLPNQRSKAQHCVSLAAARKSVLP